MESFTSSKIQVSLRIISVGLFVSTACIVGSDKQTKKLFSAFEREANFKDIKALLVLIIVDSLAVGYNILQVIKYFTCDGSKRNINGFGRKGAWLSLLLDQAFLDGERAAKYLSREVGDSLLKSATEMITGRYYELASELVSVARKTESSLQRIRQGAQRRAGANTDVPDHNFSDTDKICMQLFLDVQEYGRNLAALGVTAANIPAYCSLWQCVAPADRQDAISF